MKLTLKKTSTSRFCQRPRSWQGIRNSRWAAAHKEPWVGRPRIQGSRAKLRALSTRSRSTTRVNLTKTKKRSHFRAWRMCTAWVSIAACSTTVIILLNKFWWTQIQRLSRCLARRTKLFCAAGFTRRTISWWISKHPATKSQSSFPQPLAILISTTTMLKAALKTPL